MSNNDFSLSAAARIVGITRDTLRAHITKRPISTIQDANGNRRIEASELMRVYGNDLDFDAEKKRGSRKKKGIKNEKTQDDGTETKNLQTRLEQEQRERKEERRRHDAQVEELLKALAKSQENHNQSLLLQDQSKGVGEWQQELDDLKRQVEEQERSRKEVKEIKNEAKQREEKLKRALEAERNKSFWQRLFE